MHERTPRVFISHASQDKRFVSRLVGDLQRVGFAPWLDERELSAGDSLIAKIDAGLGSADYVFLVISKASMASRWVATEWQSAVARQVEDGGTVVVPMRLDDAHVPTILSSRLYADFRVRYEDGLSTLIGLLDHERTTATEQLGRPPSQSATRSTHSPERTCMKVLEDMRLADLRRLMMRRLDRVEVGVTWFDCFESNMENDLPGRPMVDCVITLLDRAARKRRLGLVIESLCYEHVGIVD